MPARLSHVITLVLLLSQLLSPISPVLAASSTHAESIVAAPLATEPAPDRPSPTVALAVTEPLTVTLTATPTASLPLPMLTPTPAATDPLSLTLTAAPTEPAPTEPPSGPTSVRPHAATWAGEWYYYTYDANGNLLTRFENGVTYTHTWDAENRLKTVSGGGHTVTYTYDADGQRVKKLEDGQTTVYVGNLYEKNLTTGVVTTYYYAGGQRIAQRQAGVVSYFVGDNLGSTSVTMNDTAGEVVDIFPHPPSKRLR